MDRYTLPTPAEFVLLDKPAIHPTKEKKSKKKWGIPSPEVEYLATTKVGSHNIAPEVELHKRHTRSGVPKVQKK
jgi:hypothetical protein